MGGQRSGPEAQVSFRDPISGKTMSMSKFSFDRTQGMANQINTDDISSLDRRELMGKLQTAMAGGKKDVGFGGAKYDAVESSIPEINQEIQDAVAGTKPKYRYRKYLDKVSALTSDQPGQLQTVLSRGTNGTALGGGSL